MFLDDWTTCLCPFLLVVDRTKIFWFGRTEPEPELKSPNPNRTRTELVTNKIRTFTRVKKILPVSQVRYFNGKPEETHNSSLKWMQ